jgi:tetratricopeptide (TPR) repeat protein
VLKDYENGLKMALAARKADPKYVKGIYRHAQALQGLGKLREALAAYEEGLALMPDSAQMAEGRTQVCKAIRDSESSELNAIAKLKALKEQEEKQKAAHAQQPPAATKSVAAPPIAAAGVGGAPQGPVGAAGASESGPKSGAEIKKALRNMRKDMVGLFQMMVQCAPAQLPKLLKSGLEEEELVPIIRSLAEHGVAAAPQQSFELLRGLADVPRVAIVLAMLDRKDTKMLEALLLRLHPSKASEAGLVTYDVEAWANLRKALGV